MGVIADINGNFLHDHGGMILDGIHGSYIQTTTTVHYVDQNNNKIGTDSDIKGIIGEELSVSGNPKQSDGRHWKAPDFPNAQIRDTAADKEKRTIITGEGTNEIYVVYDVKEAKMPYKVVDDDDSSSKLHGKAGNLPGSIGDAPTYSNDDLMKDIGLPNTVYIASVENNGQKITENMTTPVTVHIKHVVDKKPNQSFNRTIHFVGLKNAQQDSNQSITGTLNHDLYNDRTWAVPDPGQAFTTTNLDKKNEGYMLNSIVDGENNDLKSNLDSNDVFTWSDISKDTQTDVTATVTYSPFIGLEAPNFDFGTIQAGSPQFYGQKSQNVKSISSDLKVITTSSVNAQWQLFAKLENDFLPGESSITLYDIAHYQDKKTVITNQNRPIYDSDKWKDLYNGDGIWTLIPKDIAQGIHDIAKLKTSNLQNQKIDFNDNHKDYNGTITWNLKVVPQ